MINITGVYYIPEVRDMYNKPFPIHKMDTFYLNIMFWDDGTTAYNFAGTPDTYQLYFDEILSNMERGKKDYFFRTVSWGNYRIIGDTIKAQYVHVPENFSLNDYWYGYERCFKIINRNTLEYLPLMTKSLNWNTDKNSLDEMQKELKEKKETLAIFMPIERIPPPNCWLKQEKWFWCNEEDWKEYQKQVKK
jgi:hypothetical protein